MIPKMSSDEWEPGAVVVLAGLAGDASLNGERGRPTSAWRDGRVAVLLEKTDRSVAVRPANLRTAPPACITCLEDGGDDLFALGCGCRGTMGYSHARCAIKAAAAQQERAGTWTGPVGRHPWQLCPACKLPYTGEIKLALAREWCQRTDALALTDTQRFAARVTLGNALSAQGRLAEAETVVRGNLEGARATHGAEHAHVLGTTMNLGLLLDGQGKSLEAAALYAALVQTQARVLGEEHRDTLASRLQLAGSYLQAGGRDAEAEAAYRALLPTMSRVLGATHPATLTCEMNLASSLLNQARHRLDTASRDRRATPPRDRRATAARPLTCGLELVSSARRVTMRRRRRTGATWRRSGASSEVSTWTVSCAR